MPKKKPATEEEIGELHSLITKLHSIKLDTMIEMVDKFKVMGATEAILEIVNSKDLATVQRWVEYNKVAAIAASDNEETELSRKLRLLKETQSGKIVRFREAESE